MKQENKHFIHIRLEQQRTSQSQTYPNCLEINNTAPRLQQQQLNNQETAETAAVYQHGFTDLLPIEHHSQFHNPKHKTHPPFSAENQTFIKQEHYHFQFPYSVIIVTSQQL